MWLGANEAGVCCRSQRCAGCLQAAEEGAVFSDMRLEVPMDQELVRFANGAGACSPSPHLSADALHVRVCVRACVRVLGCAPCKALGGAG